MKFLPKKSMIGDASLRVVASLITTLVNKVILLPVLAGLLTEEAYGTALTVIGIESILSLAFANALYSVRLIMNEDYVRRKLKGDFNVLLYIGIGISLLIFTSICLFANLLELPYILALIPYVILAMSNMYFAVWYPIKLEFRAYLFQSLTTAAGSLIGLIFVKLTGFWPISYLLSAIFGFTFLYFNTGIIKEPYRTTPLLSVTTKKWIILIITTALANGMTYLDRFILHPIIGAASVAVYTTASYFGKSINIVITPISNVMLGYFANDKFKMTKKKLFVLIAFSLGVVAVFGFAVLLLGEFVTGLLFPKLLDDARPYIFIANIASAIAAVTQMIQAVTLKYADTKWQIIIQGTYAAVYIGLAVVLVMSFGILGLCISVLIANSLKFLLLLAISLRAILRREDTPEKEEPDEA